MFFVSNSSQLFRGLFLFPASFHHAFRGHRDRLCSYPRLAKKKSAIWELIPYLKMDDFRRKIAIWELIPYLKMDDKSKSQ